MDSLSLSARRLLVSALILVMATALTGCSSRPTAAQKLFEKGRYQEVIDRYPDLEIARRARAKMAEKLLQEKRYEELLRQYPQTSAAYKAKLEMAQQLFDARNYFAVIDSFPFSPLVPMAKELMADSLVAIGQYDLLLSRLGDTPKAREIKEQRATEALNAAKKLRGEARRQALDDIMRQYPGTPAYKEAATLQSKSPPPKKP